MSSSILLVDDFVECLDQFGYDEGLSFHFVELVRSEIVYLHAQVGGKLSQVLFGYHYFLVAFQYLFCVLGQRVQEAEMCQSHLLASFDHFVHS